MHWKFPIPVFLMVIFLSCTSTERRGGNEVVVRGHIEDAEGLMIHIKELTPNEVVSIDSVMADETGHFVFRQQIEDAVFFIIRLNKNNQVTLLAEPGEEIILSGDASRLTPTYEVVGSEGSALLAALNKKLWYNRQRLDTLVRDYRARHHDYDVARMRKDLEGAYFEIYHEQQAFVQSFIDQNPYSLASVMALYQYFGRRLVLKEDEHFPYFESLSKSLSETYPSNKHVMDLKRRVSAFKRGEAQRKLAEQNLAPGSLAPEIVLPDPEGNQIALSSLKGKIVLLDFWAAWCPPCRKSNKELREIYAHYQPLGFEIYAVSLDRTLEQWVLGIEEDQIEWIQVSDLRFWNSPVVGLYHVESIPHTVLIDRDGTIIDKGLSPAEIKTILAERID